MGVHAGGRAGAPVLVHGRRRQGDDGQAPARGADGAHVDPGLAAGAGTPADNPRQAGQPRGAGLVR